MKTKINSTYLLFPFMLVFYEVSFYLSNDMYLPALPDMMRDLGLSIPQAQYTLTFWFSGITFLPLILGPISDRYGRRPLLLVGGLIYISATFICAFTSDLHVLLLMRFIQGAAIPSMVVSGYACIHEFYKKKEAIKILALMASIVILAAAFGPLIGSLVLYVSNWRGIFCLIGIWSSIGLLLLYKFMPETLQEPQPIHIVSLGQKYFRVITNVKYILLNCVLGLSFFGFVIWISSGPLLILETFHYTPFAFGIIQAGIFAAYIFGNRLVKYLLEMMSISKLISLGLLTSLCGGLLIFLFNMVFPNNLYLFLIALTVYVFGIALSFAPLNRSIIESSDEPMGVRVALFTFVWHAFAVFGSLFASQYYNGSIQSLAYPITVSIILSYVINLIYTKIEVRLVRLQTETPG